LGYRDNNTYAIRIGSGKTKYFRILKVLVVIYLDNKRKTILEQLQVFSSLNIRALLQLSGIQAIIVFMSIGVIGITSVGLLKNSNNMRGRNMGSMSRMGTPYWHSNISAYHNIILFRIFGNSHTFSIICFYRCWNVV
jgi:hypothetical protein